MPKNTIKWTQIDDWTQEVSYNERALGKVVRDSSGKWTIQPTFKPCINRHLVEKKSFFGWHDASKFLIKVWEKTEERRMEKFLKKSNIKDNEDDEFDIFIRNVYMGSS